MLNNIKFSYDDQASVKKETVFWEDFNINSLPKALDVSIERKNLKIKGFLEKYADSELNAHLTQLYGFARSMNGLLKDVYREKIWPVLAENIPKVEKINSGENSQQNFYTCNEEINLNYETEEYSDSDFESAVSTFSINTNLGSNGKLHKKKKNNYYELSENDINEVFRKNKLF